MTHILTAPRWRKVNDELVDGRLRTFACRFFKGDVLVAGENGVTQDDLDRLVRLDCAVEMGSEEAEDTAPEVGQDDREPEPAEDDGVSSEAEDGDGDVEDDDTETDNAEVEDDYDNMSYSGLQDLARERDLPYNSIAKAKIVESLREYDAAQ